jgi:hypothetical protein
VVAKQIGWLLHNWILEAPTIGELSHAPTIGFFFFVDN